MFQRDIRVFYPLQNGHMVLRTDEDWDRDVEPNAVDTIGTAGNEGQIFTFKISSPKDHVYYKPCIRDGNAFYWSTGPNKLVHMTRPEPRDVYPHFFSEGGGHVTKIQTMHSLVLGREVRMRFYLPPGYSENLLKRYPVVYMHDGKNLFFPEEAFHGREWQVDETLGVLDRMNAIDRTIVVGIYSPNRLHDYSMPGYEAYGHALVEEIKPRVDLLLRTLQRPESTAVAGSSLGGLAAFYIAWQYPDVFGRAACLSSAFWYQNDLLERVAQDPLEPRHHLRIYLDSGWPGDNYEVTLSMAHALVAAGFRYGENLLHFAFPYARHNEDAWAARYHLPIQFFLGRLRPNDSGH